MSTIFNNYKNQYKDYSTQESRFLTGKIEETAEAVEEDLMEVISRKKEEILEQLEKGNPEPSIPMGASSFTLKQWNRLMERVDNAIDDAKERIRGEKIKKRDEKEEESEITMEMLSELIDSDRETIEETEEGVLLYQITTTVRTEVENALYTIKKTGEDRFTITHKETGYEYSFGENNSRLATHPESGKTFLMSWGMGDITGRVMVADETLVSMLAGYFGMETLEAGQLSGFTLEKNAATGIEILIPPGMKGKTAYMLMQSKQDVEAYERLVEIYKTQYPNLVQSEEMANFYASIEIGGLCHRTGTGILYTNAQGVSYADETDPQKSWWIRFDEQSEETYDLILDMMYEIAENGKDAREYWEWTERLDRIGAVYMRAEFDQALNEFVVEYKRRIPA